MARRVQMEDSQKETLMKVATRESESGSESDEETMVIEEENNMKGCILLSDLLCLHKKAFEATSEVAAQPTLAALGEKIGEAQAEEMRELDCIGDILEIIISHPVHAKQSASGPNGLCGLWKDDTGRFYNGSVIEIKESSWAPRGFDQDSGTKFSREHTGLVERRHDGAEKRFSMLPMPDNKTLAITHDAQKFNLTVYYAWERWEHFDVLSQVWDVLNATTIGWIVVESGPHANKFVHSLAVQVPAELAGSMSLVTLADRDNVNVLPGEFGPCHSEEQFRKMLPADWRKRPKHSTCCGQLHFLRQLCRDYKEKTPVSYYYCGVQNLFDYRGPLITDNMDHVEIMLYLEMPPDSDLMFTTPLGQAISANAWRNAFPQFVYQRSMDILFQVGLSYSLAPAARHSVQERASVLPDTWQFVLIELLMVRNLINFLLEVVPLLRMWTKERDDKTDHAVIPLPLNSVTFLRFSIEVYSIGWGFKLAYDYGPHMFGQPFDDQHLKHTCLYKHPMALSVLIFIKFLQFMMALLNSKMFRSSLLPTWFAIKSKESATFLMYMVMMTFGCSLAYMALPYASTLEHPDDNMQLQYFRPFFLLFRLNIMGDFSMDELQGRTTMLKKPDNTTLYCGPGTDNENCHWVMDSTGPHIHRLGPFLMLGVCLLALIFPVIFLNVYVGLVAEAYSDVKGNLLQVSNSYVVTSVHRELLHRQFWRSICGGVCSFDRCRRPTRREGKGAFIRLPSALTREPLEVAS